jgi:hypothetical protein
MSANLGMAMAANIPMIATTIISSIRVKPLIALALRMKLLIRVVL